MFSGAARGVQFGIVMLTALFVVTGSIGIVVLAMEVRSVLWRRRVERLWREQDRKDRHDHRK